MVKVAMSSCSVTLKCPEPKIEVNAALHIGSSSVCLIVSPDVCLSPTGNFNKQLALQSS
jgi:hypothetical protein